MELPYDIIFTIATFIDLKDVTKLRISKLWSKVVDDFLDAKFGISDSNKKYVLNFGMRELTILVTVMEYKIMPKLVVLIFNYNICMHSSSAILEQAIHNTYINSQKYIMHVGIPYDEHQLFLFGIDNDCRPAFNFLMKTNFTAKDYYLFGAVDIKHWALVVYLLENGADPFYEFKGENLFQYIIRRPNINPNDVPYILMIVFLRDNYNYGAY
jgi:hypothetical protein